MEGMVGIRSILGTGTPRTTVVLMVAVVWCWKVRVSEFCPKVQTKTQREKCVCKSRVTSVSCRGDQHQAQGSNSATRPPHLEGRNPCDCIECQTSWTNPPIIIQYLKRQRKVEKPRLGRFSECDFT